MVRSLANWFGIDQYRGYPGVGIAACCTHTAAYFAFYQHNIMLLHTHTQPHTMHMICITSCCCMHNCVLCVLLAPAAAGMAKCHVLKMPAHMHTL